MRLAIIASHPIQYQAPLFRALSRSVDLDVYFAYRASANDQAAAGFGLPFDWDIDLLSGYRNVFLTDGTHRTRMNSDIEWEPPKLGRILSLGRYDAVLVMGWYLRRFQQATLACQLRGIPALVRGDSQLRSARPRVWEHAKRVIYPIALRAFAAALHVGERSREYFEAYSYPSDRLFFSPHCVDSEWFSVRASDAARIAFRSKLKVSAEETLLLFAGKLVEFKRPTDVIDAAAQLRKTGKSISVMVAGSGPLSERMARRAQEMGVPLYLLGFQNQSQMPVVYAACDMLILPSTGRETWGLVANEALACGRPIVVSDAVGCAPDLAGDKSAGRVYPVGDRARLADAIADLLCARPLPFAIARKSAAYGLDVACSGIIEAATYCTHRPRFERIVS